MIVDTNVTLGLWPFRRLPGDTPGELVARLKRRNVIQAWAGGFDGVFHRRGLARRRAPDSCCRLAR
jgi:hypothetical protein